MTVLLLAIAAYLGGALLFALLASQGWLIGGFNRPAHGRDVEFAAWVIKLVFWPFIIVGFALAVAFCAIFVLVLAVCPDERTRRSI